MSVPLYSNAAELPIGVQFTAPIGDDHVLLQLAAELEGARPRQQRLSRPARYALSQPIRG